MLAGQLNFHAQRQTGPVGMLQVENQPRSNLSNRLAEPDLICVQIIEAVGQVTQV